MEIVAISWKHCEHNHSQGGTVQKKHGIQVTKYILELKIKRNNHFD